MTTEKRVYTNTKYWCFTWNTNVLQKKLPPVAALSEFLNRISEIAIFQEECGTIKEKVHYQGTFELIGPRISRIRLLGLFETRFKNVSGLSLQIRHSKLSSEEYVTKHDTRISGPYYCGRKEKFSIEYADKTLTEWQQDLYIFLCKASKQKILKDRIVILVKDPDGKKGKSFFQKWLLIGQKLLKTFPLDVDSVDRLKSAVCMLTSEHKNIDLFTVNLTRSKGKEQSYSDLFAAIETIKDGVVTTTMYGKYNVAVFEPPIIVIFTNIVDVAPLLEGLSYDRWLQLQFNKHKQLYKAVPDGHAGFNQLLLRDIDPEEFEKEYRRNILGET